MKRLAGRVALVTGAGRGIGRSVAMQLAREDSRSVNSASSARCGDQIGSMGREWSQWIVCTERSKRESQDAQTERPRCMSKVVKGTFVPRLNSRNERLWNDGVKVRTTS
jgi:NADP-dependent 3-hydroxy acid dehydrogenase YdfG